jgi:PAS domain S-box-containing protein
MIQIDEAFKNIANSVPIMMWVSGTDKKYHFFNNSWLKFTGKTIEEERLNNRRTEIHPDDEQRWLSVYNQYFERQKEFKIEYRLKRHDHQYRWVLEHAVPHFTKDGQFDGYVSSAVDVDELLELERIKSELISAEALKKEQALNEELASTNEELGATNEELKAANEDLAVAYEQLQEIKQQLETLNNELEEKVNQRTEALEKSEAELQATNEELHATNEELVSTNEELIATNEDLVQSQETLQQLLIEQANANETIARSEKLFRSIALNIPNSLVLVIDKEHRFIAVEGDLMTRLGFNSKIYEGKHPLEVSPPERYEASKPLYNRVLSGEQFSLERKSERGEDFMVHFVPLKNDENEVYAGLIIALDITDIRKGEEKSAMLAAIIESSNDAIVGKGLDSVVTSWNKSAEEMFGYKAEEIIGQSIMKIIPQERQHEELNIITKIKNGERVEHFETQRLTKDHRLLDLSITVSPIKNKQGQIIGASKIARDISEKKQEEARKNDFIAMVSHELKTPLTSMRAYVQLLLAKEKEAGDNFRTSVLTRAGVQAKKMSAMINDFLSLARLEEGKISLKFEEFNLKQVIDETVLDAQFLSTNHSIQVTGCDDIAVNADRDKIGQVLMNLLSNAIKYSPKGGDITIDCQRVEKGVKVSVTDHGIGISEKDQKKLFDRFYRVQNERVKTVSGFGIGLYLVSEILKYHDSKIEVESDEGKGSTFYFTLETIA